MLGKTELVSGFATASISGNALTLHASKISVAGLSLPATVVSQLASALAVPIALPALPFNLTLQSVTVGPTGVVLHAGAKSVVLTAQ